MAGREHSSCVEKLSPGLLVVARCLNAGEWDCTTLNAFGYKCDEKPNEQELFNKIACELYCCCEHTPSRGYGDVKAKGGTIDTRSHLYQSCVKVTVQAVEWAVEKGTGTKSPFRAEQHYGSVKKDQGGYFDFSYVPKGSEGGKASFVSEMKFKNDKDTTNQFDRYSKEVGEDNVTVTDENSCPCPKEGEDGLEKSGKGKYPKKSIRKALDDLEKEGKNWQQDGRGNFKERGSEVAAKVAGEVLKALF